MSKPLPLIDPRQEWATPANFWNVINAEFDFQLDAAASTNNAKCPLYITAEQDALSPDTPWVQPEKGIYRVYCNPGFSDMGPWIERAYTESQKARPYPCAVVAIIGLISPSTRWWNRWAVMAREIRLLAPRVEFVPAPGIKQSRNSRENALFIFRSTPYCKGAEIWTWQWNEAPLLAVQERDEG